MIRTLKRAGVLSALALLTCTSTPTAIELPPEGSGSLHLIAVAGSYNNPLYVTAPPSDTARLFVVEQAGTIRVVQHGQLLATPFMDITGRVGSGGERGLLSMAFHPSYATNGFFYVNYTDLNGDTHVERFSVSAADSNLADTASHKLIIFIKQPYPNHNGGLVTFGPDGMLYIGMGDGGSGGDPQNRAQNPGVLLGKILRIDVNQRSPRPYGIPKDNPFVNDTRFRPEIWTWGMRNAWRFSFDRATGVCFCGDIGQNKWEELDVITRGGNYGWRIREGTHPFTSEFTKEKLIDPIVDYGREKGASITCGMVYRGKKFPALDGILLYS